MTENISRFMAETLIEQGVNLIETQDKYENTYLISGVISKVKNISNTKLYDSIASNYGRNVDVETEREINAEIERVTKKVSLELTKNKRIKLEWVA